MPHFVQSHHPCQCKKVFETNYPPERINSVIWVISYDWDEDGEGTVLMQALTRHASPGARQYE